MAVLSSLAMAVVVSGSGVETASERDRRMAWWREARFGMFVHWGLYSGLAGTWDGKAVATSGGMEWIQQMVRADTDTYAKRAIPLFKPKPGFAREWARLAKDAGAGTSCSRRSTTTVSRCTIRRSATTTPARCSIAIWSKRSWMPRGPRVCASASTTR